MKQLFYIVLLLSILSTGCNKDSLPGQPIDRQDSISMTLQLNVPFMEAPSLKATNYLPLTSSDEMHVASCYVFAFAVDPNTDIETYSYMPSVIGSVIGSTAAKEITINLHKGMGVDHRFVFLINVDPLIEPAIAAFRVDPDRFSMTKAEVLALFSSPTSVAYNYYLPMWCESKVVEVSESTVKADLFSGGIAWLIRSVAGVNITNIAPKFVLETVSLYQTRTQAAFSVADIAAINTIPTVAGVVNVAPIPYTLSPAQLTAQSILRTIYLAEARQSDKTCMIFAGRYDGATTRTYYKFEFKSTEDLLLPILRNHLYQVQILSVVGDGYASETEAFNSSIPLQTFKAQVINWSLMQGDDFADGSLSVSHDRMIFDFHAGTRVLSVYSSRPFTVDVSALPAGFTVSPLTGAAYTKVDLTVNVPDAGTDYTNLSTQMVISNSESSQIISIQQIRDRP